MGKSIFTIVFLIIALLVATKVKSFIENNKPIVVPETVLPTKAPIPEGFTISTSTEMKLQMQTE